MFILNVETCFFVPIFYWFISNFNNVSIHVDYVIISTTLSDRLILQQWFKKTKQAKFSEKRTFLTPWYGYQGVRNVCFLENLACCAFLKHPFWDSSFCLIIDDTTTIKAKVLVVWICRANSDVGKVIITLKYQFPFARFWSRTTIFE